jgi:dihydrofolate reductase
MSKVFVNIGLSLDGYITPEGMDIEHWDRPEYKNWGANWRALMSWILKQQYFRENLNFETGGETGPVNDMLRHTMERSGASIMGKRMFDAGERSWPEEAPFHTTVYVLNHEKREPWVRPGGTTFRFFNDGPASAIEKAREYAGGRDIRISGGADVIQQYFNMGLLTSWRLPWLQYYLALEGACLKACTSPCRSFESTRCSTLQVLRTCAVCVM